jgi:hypothetical protein
MPAPLNPDNGANLHSPFRMSFDLDLKASIFLTDLLSFFLVASHQQGYLLSEYNPSSLRSYLVVTFMEYKSVKVLGTGIGNIESWRMSGCQS